jgi:hydroxymethylpyrimidine pyrophosphatase-like HAD family hydrolase
VSLEAREVSRAIAILRADDLDFMVHRPIPDNHVFGYFESTPANADFRRRIDLYSQFAFPLDEVSDGFGAATQLLAILPPAGRPQIIETIRKKLPGFNIIQTTSPLDGQSTWIEIFPATVSKGLTVAWLTAEFDIDPGQTLSIGNDYNDLDLLEWTASSFVVENAPDDLKERFPVVASNNESGVAEGIKRWLASSQF